MSERKAINKWYPPDYDPSKVPKKEKSRNAGANKSRLMLPFSMKCLQCNEYIAARRKFNARKETTNEKYMGFKIIKFHIKCPRCSNSIVFRTDPALAGFAPVEGGVRNYESLVKEPKIKPMETEDEILSRLEKEEEESKKFKEQQERRKKNPFWQGRNETGSDVMTNLEEKLAKQQEDQEMHDHLVYLQAKANRLQESGGQDKLTSTAQSKLADERRSKEDFGLDKSDLEKLNYRDESAEGEKRPLDTVSGVITVKRPRKLAHRLQLSEHDNERQTDKEVNEVTEKKSPPSEIVANGIPGLAGYGSDSD